MATPPLQPVHDTAEVTRAGGGGSGPLNASAGADAVNPADTSGMAGSSDQANTSETSGFVHLHLHSEYSLLDGGNRLDKLVARVKALGMDAVAVTDHGNLFAAVQFYEVAKKEGIKPILGCEAYVAPGDRRDRTHTGVSDGGYHLVLLAENNTGWRNLMALASLAYLEGFYYKPRMDRQSLERHADGLIAINGHLGSELALHLMRYEATKDRAHWAAAVEVAEWHRSVFKPDEAGRPRFFVELQHHVAEQLAINPHLIRLARELGLPLVCDNDSHFLMAEDHDAHDTLVCISTGKSKFDEARQKMKYPAGLYVKSPAEMRAMFAGPEYNNETFGRAGLEALANTRAIADRCEVELPIGANHAPVVVVRGPEAQGLPRHDDPRFGGDLTAWFKAVCAMYTLHPAGGGAGDAGELKEACDSALRALCEAGMVWRYGPGILGPRHGLIEGTPEAGEARARYRGDVELDGFDKWARLNRELKILADKLISAYFLIVWDFVNWGRQRGIPALARGSGVGTMAGFVLGLSNACPVRFGLLFERFTDPDRSEYPDIDIDLCQDGRGDVIRYVREKYGHVAQIITFGTLKARAAIRDVCRVLEVPLAEADRLAKLVPEELKITIDRALEQEPELAERYGSDAAVRRVLDTARVIEGQARHASVHAAGVIVATRPLHELVPLYKQPGGEEDEVITQWDGPTCEKMGLLKMDFLGLRTLTIIERARSLIVGSLPVAEIYAAVGREAGDGGPHPLDLDRLAMTDANVYALFQRGDTTGVFQFESGGMRRLLLDMRPDRLEDLIAANALFRPGPMDLIPDYNRRKHGQDAVPRIHPIVDKHTASTYGVMVYQEQVMQIVHELGGIPLRQAYGLIKAISKKKHKVIDAERPRFVEGAGRQGLAKKEAEELFELILKFAGYGFNKSHSTGYAIVAYQTAYLKAYFPAQYMAAFLTMESRAQKVADWLPYLEDCKKTRCIDPISGRTIREGVEVRPPDINLSGSDFSVVYAPGERPAAHRGHIRFGLRAIKGAGAKAIEAIVTERAGRDGQTRPYASLHDFCERLPQGAAVNRAMIEALVKAGCFDSVHGRVARAALVASVADAIAAGQKIAADRARGQSQLFGLGDDGPPDSPAGAGATKAAPLAKAPAWSESETLRQEKETLGFYVSSHPLEEWQPWTRVFTDRTCASLAGMKQDERVVLPALVQSVRGLVVKAGRSAGQKMGILTIEDTTGTAEAVMFANVYAQFGHLVESSDRSRPVFVMGRVDLSRGEPQVIVDRLVPIEGCPLERGRLILMLREDRLNGSASRLLPEIKKTLEAAASHAHGQPHAQDRGQAHAQPPERVGVDVLAAASAGVPTPYEVIVETNEAWVTMTPTANARIVLEPESIRRLSGVLGIDGVRLVGGVSVELNREERRHQRKPAASR